MSNNLSEALISDTEVMLEYSYQKLSSAKFSYHKYKDPNKPGKFIDNGVCEVCGRKGSYLLVEKDKPHMCYRCYQSVRAYRTLSIDVLHLQKKKTLTVKQCKSIVQYMRNYAKKKALALGLVATYLLNKK